MTNQFAEQQFDHDDKQGQSLLRQEQDDINNTAPSSNNELRETIAGWLRNYTDIARDSEIYAAEMQTLIKKAREEAEIDARLDELNKMGRSGAFACVGNRVKDRMNEHICDRFAELETAKKKETE